MALSDWSAKVMRPLRRDPEAAVPANGHGGVVSDSDLLARLEAAEARLEKLEQWSNAYDNTLVTARYLLGTQPPSNRGFGAGQRNKLLVETADLVGDKIDLKPIMRQTYQAVFDLETRSLGRIAGSVSNVMGKLLTTPLLPAPDGPILEIGTLFGVFGAGLHRQYRRLGYHRKLVVVDPLEGVQIQPHTSMKGELSGSPVIRDVVEHNFHLAGLPPEDYTIIQGYSTDPAVQAEVAKQKYAVIVIDGDHSEEGVYKDLEFVETIALDGAVIVLDDYGDGKWKGVERAVKRYLDTDTRMRLLGRVSTSGYVRFGNDPV
jgi:hypothetical protein